MEQTDNQNGIVTGCDKNQEWILPWFWHFYSRTNSYPVAFADIGMTEKGRGWCEARGIVFDPRAEIREKVEKDNLPAWSYKPFAIQKSPFRRSLWIDLDAMVCRDLFDAFLFCHGKPGAAVDITSNWGGYNGLPFTAGCLAYQGGVLVAERDDPIIVEWARFLTHTPQRIQWDDVALSYMLHQTGRHLNILPLIFNMPAEFGLESTQWPVHIRHFHSEPGKAGIKKMVQDGLDTEPDLAAIRDHMRKAGAERQRAAYARKMFAQIGGTHRPPAQATQLGDGHADTGAGEG